MFDAAALDASYDRIRSYVRETPLVEVAPKWVGRSDLRLFLKLECKQVSGSFKARGAYNYLLQTQEGADAPLPGVVTYSSGNHGRAVAEVAASLGFPATITVPETIDPSKRAAIERAGARVIEAGRTSESRKKVAEEIVAETGYVMCPPFDHPWIIQGQSTVASEIVRSLPDVTAIWSPVGGGGLAAGTCSLVRAKTEAEFYAVEPEGACALAKSLAAGERQVLESTESVADGLLPLAVGETNWECLRAGPVTSVTVDDTTIRASLARLRHDCDVAAEPSGAVACAPLLMGIEPWLSDAPAGTHVAIVSGGNVDPARLERILSS